MLPFFFAEFCRPKTLRSHLILLVLSTLVPLLIFAVVMIARLSNEERLTLERGAKERARALLTAVDSELRSSIDTLEALAASRHFDTDNLRGFYEDAARVIKTQPSWFTVILGNPKGEQVLNLRRPFGDKLPAIAEPESFRQVLQGGKPLVGGITKGSILERYGFAVRVPIVSNGSVRYVLSAIVDPQSLNRLLLAQKVPSDWTAGIIDSNGRLVARTIEPERHVGQLASASLRSALEQASEGWFYGTTREGWPTYASYSRSSMSGWSVAIAIPSQAVEASLRRSILYVSAFGLILLGFGIALAGFLGSRTARSIESLSRLARNLGSGREIEADGKVPSRIAEVENVRTALFAGSRLIQERSAERDRVEAELRQTTEWLELAQESASVGVFERNLASGEIKWSYSQEKLYGLEPGSFTGRHEDWTARVHPEDIETVESAVQNSAETHIPFDVEFRIVRPDGSVRWIASRGRVFADDAGRRCRLVGTNIDATTRKQSQQKLAQVMRQKEALYEFVEQRHRAASLGEIYDAALDAIVSSLRCDRASILLLDDAGVMRFVAWRGLSDVYRKAVEGHSPWKADDPDPRPVTIPDCTASDVEDALKTVLAREGISALAFIPIVIADRLAGKFMIYYDAPHAFDREEMDLSLTIGLQLALGIERKRSEEMLRERQQELSDFFDTASQGLHWVDRDGIILRANKAELKMLGYTETEYVGHHISDFHADADVCGDIMRRLLRGEILHEYPARMKCRDGSLRDVVINSSVYWRDGRFMHTRCFTRDVTELKEAEHQRAALLVREREVREEAETLNQVARTLAAELDLEKLLQVMTDAATKLTAAKLGAFFYNVEKEDGEAYMLYALSGARREDFDGFGMPRNTPLFADTFRGTRVVRSADIRLHPNYGKNSPHYGMPEGHLSVRSYLAVPVVSRSGEIIGGLFFGHPEPGIFAERAERIAVGIAAQAAIAIDNARLFEQAQREIAERKQAEERLKRFNEELEQRVAERTAEIQQRSEDLLRSLEEREKLEAQLRQSHKMESIGILAGGIAHDINNILNIIKAYALLAERQAVPEPKLLESLKIIDDTVERGAAVVRQLLTLARKAETHLAPGHLNEIISDLTNLLSETFPKDIQIWIDLHPHVPPVMMDASQISQALLNLCLNARDAMQGGGRLTIRTALVAGAALRNRHPKANGCPYACVEVIDTGVGIDPDVQNRIFEPFFTTKAIGEGTGLGLAIAYGIVTAHDGFIDVDSGPGHGATFKLYLPMDKAPDLESEAIAKREPGKIDPPQPGATILVVEDEESMARLLEKKLVGRGYRVYVALDGQEAVDLYDVCSQDISLVLLDIGLPRLGGVDVMMRLKEKNPHVNVIVMSGYIDPGLRSRLFQIGVKEFIQKPFLPDKVIDHIRELLGR